MLAIRPIRLVLAAVVPLLLNTFPLFAADRQYDEIAPAIEAAAQYRREGNIRTAIELLEKLCGGRDVRRQLGNACPARVVGELGATYYQANLLTDADECLQDAYAKTSGPAERALVANDLGNLHARQGHTREAISFYGEARRAGNLSTKVSAGLNLARLLTSPDQRDQRLKELVSLSESIGRIADKRSQARYLVNLGSQAQALGAPGHKMAYESLSRARVLSTEVSDRWLLAESLDALAQLYEDQNSRAQALMLTEEAIAQLGSEQAQDLLINLHWRRGRLLRTEGRDDLALPAYRSAVQSIEAVRQDIPVTYVDGRSSFRDTLEPIYLGLAELLLQQAGKASGKQREELYRATRDTVELIKQTELQDYLGNRCTVESARPLYGSSIPARSAVLYPIIFDDRLALLLATSDGIQVREVHIASASLRKKVSDFVKQVTVSPYSGTEESYLPLAQELYDILLRPVEPLLAPQIDTLVVVPDGVLRMVPMAALHDGQHFAIGKKFAIAIAVGLTISGEQTGNRAGKLLLAGLADPGPVVDKLPEWFVDLYAPGEPKGGARSAQLRKELTLPAVTEEMGKLKPRVRDVELLNQEFTVDRFRKEVGAGGYRIVHIASHAVFRSTAEESFVMAYDGILHLHELQGLLLSDAVQSEPIELLSLSACQTAEGNDRVPLGIAGAALRARAASALGSLWRVDDASAARLMPRFYDLLTTAKLSKAKALQRAQRELIADPEYAHPRYWAPFILLGNWQ